MTRDERQELTIQRWKEAKGLGITLLATGYGKTIVAMKILSKAKAKGNNLNTLVIVPTLYLKAQWQVILDSWGLKADVMVVNSAAMRQGRPYDLLIVDELHLTVSNQFISIFDKYPHKYFLGLTGTIDRLDGREELVTCKYPIVDVVTVEEAVRNQWLNSFTEYEVMLDIENMETYRALHRDFSQSFSYFNYDFTACMAMVADPIKRQKFADKHNKPIKEVNAKIFLWMKAMRERKAFSTTHPKKVEIANRIIQARPDAKIITFSATTDQAGKLCEGDTYHSKMTKKQRKLVMDKFDSGECRVLNTVKAMNQGVDLKGLSVGITLSGNSSSITRAQTRGRVIRKEEGKEAEFFHLVIGGTNDEDWIKKSRDKTAQKPIILPEKYLDRILYPHD